VPWRAVTGFMCFQHQFILFLNLLEICKSCYRPSRALCNSCYDCKTMRSVLRYAIPATERQRTMRFVTYAIPVTSRTETMRSAHYVILVTSHAETMRAACGFQYHNSTRRNDCRLGDIRTDGGSELTMRFVLRYVILSFRSANFVIRVKLNFRSNTLRVLVRRFTCSMARGR